MDPVDASVEKRQQLLSRLGAMDRAITIAFRTFLSLVLLLILGVVAYVIVRRPWGEGHQGEWFYFGVGVLFLVGWVITKYVELSHRQRRWDLPMSVRAVREGDAQGWELRIGSSPESGGEPGIADGRFEVNLSQGLQIPLGSVARDALPDERGLKRLEAELEAGAELDEACRAVQPAYADWNMMARWAYRKYVTTALEQARAARGREYEDEELADRARW